MYPAPTHLFDHVWISQEIGAESGTAMMVMVEQLTLSFRNLWLPIFIYSAYITYISITGWDMKHMDSHKSHDFTQICFFN